MSTFNRMSSPDIAVPDPSKHVNFELGMVLGRDDFMQEFAYHNGRDQWIARDLLGYGTVTGLTIAIGMDNGEPRVEVGSGVALSPLGQMIRVCTAQCAVLNDWLKLNKDAVLKELTSPPLPLKLYVVLCYRECLTEEVPIPGEPCRSEDDSKAFSRIKDNFKLDLRLSPPHQQEEDAIRDFAEWLRSIDISDAPSISTPLPNFLTALRNAAHNSDSPSDFMHGSPPDFMLGSPPTPVHITTADGPLYMREAFRLWATELRPTWRPDGLGNVGCCPDHKATDTPEAEECLLLAALDLTLDAELRVKDKVDVLIDESRRPYLLHLRFLQEWLLGTHKSNPTAPITSNLLGDVTGDPSANTLVAIQGVPIQSPPGGVLADDSVLMFKNNAWQGQPLPAPPVTPTITLDGDVRGAPDGNAIFALQGKSVEVPDPQQSEVLTFDNGVWKSIPLPVAAVVPDLGGDLSGAISGSRVERIQGVKITIPSNPPDGRVVTTQGAELHLAPPNPLPVGKDLEGSTETAKVVGLQGLPVTMTGATSGEVLTFRGGEWRVEPSQPQPVRGDFVEHPANLPKYFIVAAGLVRGDGSPAGSYNGLFAKFDPTDILRVTFDNYESPERPGAKHQYIIKVLPVELGEQSPIAIVNFSAFQDQSFTLRVVGTNGRPLPEGDLPRRQFMIEVSQYLFNV